MNSAANQLSDFRRDLHRGAARYDIPLAEGALNRLCIYYELVLAWNARLHLVAPCSAAEFATRHVLESLLVAKHLPENGRVADIGSGAGLPIIPNLIVRPDIQATLIESSPKKCVFLREALRHCELSAQATVTAERFENVPAPAAEYVTCRALDRFSQILCQLVEWAPRPSTLLLFGGDAVRREIEQAGLGYSNELIPETQRRFLFVCRVRSR